MISGCDQSAIVHLRLCFLTKLRDGITHLVDLEIQLSYLLSQFESENFTLSDEHVKFLNAYVELWIRHDIYGSGAPTTVPGNCPSDDSFCNKRLFRELTEKLPVLMNLI